MSKNTAKTIKVNNTKWVVFDTDAIQRVFGRVQINWETGKFLKRNAKGHFCGSENFRVAASVHSNINI
jgi:hypothetical protein